MKTNESGLDRVIRVTLGLILVMLYSTGFAPGGLGFTCLVIGGILIITGSIGFSPLYALVKIKTKKK
jgi:hypothetical protein